MVVVVPRGRALEDTLGMGSTGGVNCTPNNDQLPVGGPSTARRRAFCCKLEVLDLHKPNFKQLAQ